MFISDLIWTATIFGDELSKSTLWIKSCYMKTQESPKELTPITLKLEFLLSQRVQI
jgi:hypothetical protein